MDTVRLIRRLRAQIRKAKAQGDVTAALILQGRLEKLLWG